MAVFMEMKVSTQAKKPVIYWLLHITVNNERESVLGYTEYAGVGPQLSTNDVKFPTSQVTVAILYFLTTFYPFTILTGRLCCYWS